MKESLNDFLKESLYEFLKKKNHRRIAAQNFRRNPCKTEYIFNGNPGKFSEKKLNSLSKGFLTQILKDDRSFLLEKYLEESERNS